MSAEKSFVMQENVKTATTEAFGRALSEVGDKNPKIVALTADLKGSTKIGYFGDKHPDRIFDVGIAEQNMFGMATGMAQCGFVPFAATFSVFATLRALDQIHTDICYQNVNVKIVGTHGGTSFAAGGSTHHAIEDFAVMRGLVNMTIICPADGVETSLATKAAAEKVGPMFIRINRGTDYVVYNTEDYGFEIGKAVTLRDGSDITLIACGACVHEAIVAARILEEKHGIKARVLDMHTIKPIDKEAVAAAVSDTHRIITVEDHSVIGGLGSAVAEVAVECGKACAFRRLGLRDHFSAIGGSHDDLMSMYEINADGIVKNALELIQQEI